MDPKTISTLVRDYYCRASTSTIPLEVYYGPERGRFIELHNKSEDTPERPWVILLIHTPEKTVLVDFNVCDRHQLESAMNIGLNNWREMQHEIQFRIIDGRVTIFQ